MNDQRLTRMGRAARDEFLRENFGAFLRQCFKTLHPDRRFLPNWHLELIGAYLQACAKGDIRRLIINLPPRALKSIAVSVAWPAFLLGHDPSRRIVTASYAANLSIKHSLDCRTIMQSEWYRRLFPETKLSGVQNEKHKFATTRFGHRIATSVGGSVTGEGGDILIMDDPQNPGQAMAEATRNQAAEWFDQTFVSRLDDKRKGAIVVVMQRLHEDDLTGHLLRKGGWEVLDIPAVAERDREYRCGTFRAWRKEGQVLQAEREDAGMLAELKRELGSRAYAAQYQQNPAPEQGEMVRREWFRRHKVSPEAFTRIVQSWDTGIKAGDRHDPSVCITFGEREGEAFVLDVTVLKAEYPELRRIVVRMAGEYGADAVLLEDKGSGQSLIQDIRAYEGAIAVLPICPVQDKVTRFAAVSAMIEAGMVSLPVEAAWLAAFEQEILAFPAGRHDDQVDALSQYLNWRRGKTPPKYRIRSL